MVIKWTLSNCNNDLIEKKYIEHTNDENKTSKNIRESNIKD